jgi:sec-independent protein translocase protein TatA
MIGTPGVAAAMIGSLGVPELIFILVLVLLVFGPKRLPEIGRTVGKGLAEFRKASGDLKRTINAELALEEEPRPPLSARTAALRAEPAGTAARFPELGSGPEVADAADPDVPPPDLLEPVDPVARDAAEEPGARPIEPT